MKHSIFNSRRREGFTIIELLISIALFSVVVTIAVGGFTRALRLQRQTQSLLSVNTSLNQALEIFAREVRTGGEFSNPSGPSTLQFTNARQESVTYLWHDQALWRAVGGSEKKITSDNVLIVNASFLLVQGSSPLNDGYPPRVTLALKAAPNSSDPAITQDIIQFQTTVSARLIDDIPPTVVVQKFVSGGTATPDAFVLTIMGRRVRPCLTLENYVASLRDKNGNPLSLIDQQSEISKDRDYLTNKGVCKNYYTANADADICLFGGDIKGTVFNMAEGQYCVDELPTTFYNKSFARACGETTPPRGENATPPTYDSVLVNQQRVCTVQNIFK